MVASLPSLPVRAWESQASALAAGLCPASNQPAEISAAVPVAAKPSLRWKKTMAWASASASGWWGEPAVRALPRLSERVG